jgi:hypothetical protein
MVEQLVNYELGRWGRKQSWLNLQSEHLPENIMENVIQDRWSVAQDLNPGPPRYKASMLTTLLIISSHSYPDENMIPPYIFSR